MSYQVIKEDINLNSQLCKICNSVDTQLYCKKNGYKIIKCFSCGCGFLDLTSISFDPESFYQSYYKEHNQGYKIGGYDNYFALEKALKFTFQKRTNMLVKYFKIDLNKPLLLDIGCGPGFFLELASRYFDAYGVEISKEAADYAKNSLHLKVINSSFNPDFFEPNKFDIVTLWDTIEHIDNPHNLLEGILRILKENGILAFTTGDISSTASLIFRRRWHLLTVPEHLLFFSKKGIKGLLKNNDFEIMYFCYPASYVTLDYLFERIIKSLNIAQDYRKLSNFRIFFNKFIVPINLCDIMLVIAKKKPINLAKSY